MIRDLIIINLKLGSSIYTLIYILMVEFIRVRSNANQLLLSRSDCCWRLANQNNHARIVIVASLSRKRRRRKNNNVVQTARQEYKVWHNIVFFKKNLCVSTSSKQQQEKKKIKNCPFLSSVRLVCKSFMMEMGCSFFAELAAFGGFSLSFSLLQQPSTRYEESKIQEEPGIVRILRGNDDEPQHTHTHTHTDCR